MCYHSARCYELPSHECPVYVFTDVALHRLVNLHQLDEAHRFMLYILRSMSVLYVVAVMYAALPSGVPRTRF